jgi:hypothetical protein
VTEQQLAFERVTGKCETLFSDKKQLAQDMNASTSAAVTRYYECVASSRSHLSRYCPLVTYNVKKDTGSRNTAGGGGCRDRYCNYYHRREETLSCSELSVVVQVKAGLL